MLKHGKIKIVSHVYKKLQICGMNYFFFFFSWREITCEQEQFSAESLCFAKYHVNLVSEMALAVAGHQFRGVKQLKTENKLNQTQNFPD